MAITLGKVYPDVFRAVGAHSGLPHASAHDVPSAFAAMAQGPEQEATVPGRRRQAAPPCRRSSVHGDHDRTVNVRNATEVVDDARGTPHRDGASTAGGAASDHGRLGKRRRRHSFTTTRIRDAAGRPQVESWIVHGGGHAWFGGSADGTCTDTKGPNASAEMLRFLR